MQNQDAQFRLLEWAHPLVSSFSFFFRVHLRHIPNAKLLIRQKLNIMTSKRCVIKPPTLLFRLPFSFPSPPSLFPSSSSVVSFPYMTQYTSIKHFSGERRIWVSSPIKLTVFLFASTPSSSSPSSPSSPFSSSSSFSVSFSSSSSVSFSLILFFSIFTSFHFLRCTFVVRQPELDLPTCVSLSSEGVEISVLDL